MDLLYTYLVICGIPSYMYRFVNSFKGQFQLLRDLQDSLNQNLRLKAISNGIENYTHIICKQF